MADDLLQALESKVVQALDLIALLRLQLRALEEENSMLKEHAEWRQNLKQVMQRFDTTPSATQEPR